MLCFLNNARNFTETVLIRMKGVTNKTMDTKYGSGMEQIHTKERSCIERNDREDKC
jgi:hypothetical protein